MKFEQFIADSMKRVSVFDLSNNDLLFMATQIQDGSLSGTVDQQEITGMNGIVIARLDRSKGASVSWTNGLIVTNGIAAQAGAEITDASDEAPIVAPAIELVELKTETTATLPSTPVGTNVKIYKVSKTGGQGEQLAFAPAAEKGKFAIDGAEITFADGEFAKGDKFYAIYDYEATSGTKISNKSDSFTKSVKVIAEIIVRDVCDDTVYISKLVFPRAKLSGDFEISLGEAANHPFEAQALTDLCGTDQTLWNWFIVE
ncbi:hypothetical protein D7X33_07335 [Butyricicoccus sp. 1XD8-22]|nr:hypothetical protein D7X33_07335 [Butyricicoccus sp. 1XD8-22]